VSYALTCPVLRAPKSGGTESEYEDASWAPDDGRPLADGCTIAMADGASESMLAGDWARMLTRALGSLVGHELNERAFAAVVCEAAARWPRHLRRYTQRRAAAGRPITWYEEPKLRLGAHAALIGISFHSRPERGVYSGDGGVWTATAIGDCCVFQVRHGKLVEAFPLSASKQFDSTPQLVGSRHPDRDLLIRRAVTRRGTWSPFDEFYLATDAAALWFITEHEIGVRNPWLEIAEIFESESDLWPGWLARERAERRMRDDDVTIMKCSIVSS
jgi:hypothetical protein